MCVGLIILKLDGLDLFVVCCFHEELIRDIVICLIHVRTYVSIINSQEAETNESWFKTLVVQQRTYPLID